MSAAPVHPKFNRRNFLRAGAAAAGGLFVGFHLPEGSLLEAEGTTHKLNAWVHVGTNNNVTLYIHKCEMGQGTVTSLSMLLAEELECDWSKIRPAFPGVDRAYGQQMVVGSQSIRGSYNSLRQAGAQARTMLVQAAAQKWGVDAAQCRAENSFVINNASNARVSFGDVAEDASKLPVPTRVALKDASQFQIIGKPRKRLDTPSKSNGSAKFGLDARVPGMSFAVVSRCAVFGGKVAKFDATAAKAVPGVKNVVEIPSGIAVIADNTWNAMQGRKALNVTWDEGPRATISSASMRAEWKARAENPGAVARNDGDAPGAIASASRKLEAVYEVPYLAHAPMEPLNCTASVTADSCEVWVSSQGQTGDQQAAMRITGLPAGKVIINSLYMGGGFGRRARTDYVEEAVHISKTIGAPVQLVWTREDDMQQDAYRPASYTRFWGALDADGWPAALSSRVVCPPFGGGGAISRVAIEGIVDSPYAVPNFHVEYHNGDVAPDQSIVAGIPVSYWRSVGYSQNVFFNEGFMDELAALGKKDPLEMRRRLLAKNPRALAVLEIAATKAGWGKPLPKGHGLGIAVGNNIGSFTAEIAEVSVINGKLRIHRVVCAVDCGQPVNPSGIEQQIQSGIVYGLSAALKGAITIDKGRVQQANFNNYDLLRIDEMPAVEVHIVPSTANPGGIGEASTPPIAGAVANAVFAAAGKRIRRLPIRPEDLA